MAIPCLMEFFCCFLQRLQLFSTPFCHIMRAGITFKTHPDRRPDDD